MYTRVVIILREITFQVQEDDSVSGVYTGIHYK